MESSAAEKLKSLKQSLERKLPSVMNKLANKLKSKSSVRLELTKKIKRLERSAEPLKTTLTTSAARARRRGLRFITPGYFRKRPDAASVFSAFSKKLPKYEEPALFMQDNNLSRNSLCGRLCKYLEGVESGCDAWSLGPAPAQPKNLIEHPVVLKKLRSEVLPKLFLTESERKAIRKEERMAKEQRKRDQITMGFIEPPGPKIKVSNVFRVLGSKALSNPTASVQLAMKEEEARRQRHLQTNAERALTAEQRREKQKQHWLQADGQQFLSLYKLQNALSRKSVYKIAVNAKQLQLSGFLLHRSESAFCALIVEGSQRATNRFDKLLRRRVAFEREGRAVPASEAVFRLSTVPVPVRQFRGFETKEFIEPARLDLAVAQLYAQVEQYVA